MPAMKLVAPVTPHDQVRGGRRLAGEKLQDGQGSLVRPVQVLNQENGGGGACIQAKRTQKRPEQAITAGNRLACYGCLGGQRQQLGYGPLERRLAVRLAHDAADDGDERLVRRWRLGMTAGSVKN